MAVSPHHGAIDLGFDAGGQCGGIDQIGEQDCQATDLAAVFGGSEQFFGVWIAAVNCQHLPGEGIGSRPIAAVDCLHCAVEQLIDRGLGHGCAHRPIVARIAASFAVLGQLCRESLVRNRRERCHNEVNPQVR